MNLTQAHKRYFLREQLVTPALVNFVANGAISWLSLKNAVEINYWQATPIAVDLLLTGLLLPFIMTMINSRLIAAKVYRGELDDVPPAELGATGWHRRSIFARSVFLGAAGVLAYALPTIIVLPMIWPEPLAFWGFVVFKALWAAVLAVVVCPVIAVWAIEDASLHSQPR